MPRPNGPGPYLAAIMGTHWAAPFTPMGAETNISNISTSGKKTSMVVIWKIEVEDRIDSVLNSSCNDDISTITCLHIMDQTSFSIAASTFITNQFYRRRFEWIDGENKLELHACDLEEPNSTFKKNRKRGLKRKRVPTNNTELNNEES